MKIETKKQRNDLETVFINSPGSTMGCIQIWFRAGSALENPPEEGIAHFLEHMFFKGTPKRPDAKISNDVENFGGEINAFTSFDYTCYYINCPDDNIIESTDILMDMVANPQFLQKDIIPEREVVFEEYLRSIDNPNQFAFNQMQKYFFKGKYSHPILGNKQTIKNFSKKDLISFRKKYYNSNNAFLVVAGDLEKDKSFKAKLVRKINQYKLPKGNSTQFERFTIKPRTSCNIHFKDVEMAKFHILIQAPNIMTKDAACEDLAINCLGHGNSSILYKNLVLQNTIANACSSHSMFMRDAGFHSISFNCPLKNLKQSFKILIKTLTSILDTGFNQKDLEKIKNQYIASHTYEKESIENFAFSKGHSLATTLSLESEDKFLKNISDTNLKQINNSIKEILTRNIKISLQLPVQETKNKKQWKQEIDFFIEKYKTQITNHKTKIVSKDKDNDNDNDNDNDKKDQKKYTKSTFDSQAFLYDLTPQIKLLYRQNTSAETFEMQAYLHGGLQDENKSNNGIFSLISEMLSKGYEKLSFEELMLDLDNSAAHLDGFVGNNAYGIKTHGLTQHFNKLLQHFIGSIFSPSFPKEEFKREKELTLRHLEIIKKDPVKQCFKKANEVFFANHPYSMSKSGTIDSINNIILDDMKKLHTKKTQEQILIAYSGDLSFDIVLDNLKQVLPTNILKTKKIKENKNLKTRTRTKLKNGQQIHLEFDREQTHILIAFPTEDIKNPTHLYLKILSAYLEGQSSPLFVNVRDKQGLCYTAQPIHYSALEAGYWGIYMASSTSKVKEAKQAIFALLDAIKQKGLSKKDFTQLKKKIYGSEKMQLQTNQDFLNFYSVNSFQNLGIDFFHLQNERVQELTHENFNQQIKIILDKSFSVITVGK